MEKSTSLWQNDPVTALTEDLGQGQGKLTYPHHAVFGTTDFPRLAAFFSIFGYQPRKLEPLEEQAANALYGLDREAEQWLLRSAGLDGPIRVVQTPNRAERANPMQVGPYGLDIYSSDLRLTLEVVKAAGFPTTDIVKYEVGGWPREEARALGPEEFTIFLIESIEQRYPSALDREYWRAHSQMHMLCWIVDRIDDERRFWQDEAGMRIVRDVALDPQAMVDLMDHPRPVRFGATQVSDPAIHRRMELMYFVDDQVPRRPDWPLRGGFHGGAFRTQNLDEMLERLPSASFRPVTLAKFGTNTHRVVAGTSPGGVRFELWEPQ